MWNYEKRLEYPVNIKNVNPAMAKLIITQLGGPDGEMGAATRYLSQRYSAPYAEVKATMTDIGSEEAKEPGGNRKNRRLYHNASLLWQHSRFAPMLR